MTERLNAIEARLEASAADTPNASGFERAVLAEARAAIARARAAA